MRAYIDKYGVPPDLKPLTDDPDGIKILNTGILIEAFCNPKQIWHFSHRCIEHSFDHLSGVEAFDKLSIAIESLESLAEKLKERRGIKCRPMLTRLAEAIKKLWHMKFSTEIKALRKRNDITQAQFSKAFGIPLATLRNWEQGKNEPSDFTKAQLRKSGGDSDWRMLWGKKWKSPTSFGTSSPTLHCLFFSQGFSIW